MPWSPADIPDLTGRRALVTGLPVKALVAHPGHAGTGLFETRWMSWFGQSPADGALPTLMAATADLPGWTSERATGVSYP